MSDQNKFSKKKNASSVIIAAIIITVVLHAAPFYIFHLYVPEADTANVGRHFAAMIGLPESMGKQKADFDYWLFAGRADLVAKPDAAFGFSALVHSGNDPMLSPIEIPDQDLSLSFLQTESEPSPEKRSLGRLPMDVCIPMSILPVQFNLSSEKTFQEDSIARLSIHAEGAGPILRETVLLIRHSANPDLPPQFRIYQSCGDPKLDILAERHASISISAMPEKSRISKQIILIDWKPRKQENKSK